MPRCKDLDLDCGYLFVTWLITRCLNLLREVVVVTFGHFGLLDCSRLVSSLMKLRGRSLSHNASPSPSPSPSPSSSSEPLHDSSSDFLDMSNTTTSLKLYSKFFKLNCWSYQQERQ